MRYAQRLSGGFGSGWLVLSLVTLFFAPFVHAQSSYLPVLVNGPTANRVNLAFLGDGYTADQLETVYPEQIHATLQHFFDANQDPFPRYRNFFNVYRINVASAESGATDPTQGIHHNTALGARYNYDGVNAYALYMDSGRVTVQLAQAFKDAPFKPQAALVAVNSDRAGGASGMYACFSAGFSQGSEIALHEFGHVFAGLADEYGGNQGVYSGLEPTEVNVTTGADGSKWSRWLGFDQAGVGVIGAYEGADYFDHGIFCPAKNSKMRYLGSPFNSVCREKIILDIYRSVRPLDAWLDNTEMLVNPESVWVKTVDASVIKITWQVDGVKISGLSGETFKMTDVGFEAGNHTITARAVDPTDWVREHRDLLEQTITWNVHLTAPIVQSRAPGAALASAGDEGTTGSGGGAAAGTSAIGGSGGVLSSLGSDTMHDLFSMANGSICGMSAVVVLGMMLMGFGLVSNRA